MSEAYRVGTELRGLYDFLKGFSGAECPAEAVRPGQGIELSGCLNRKGDDHSLLFLRIDAWQHGAVDLAEEAGSTDSNHRVSAIRIVTPGIYHVSAGMRFGREDRLHAWGVARNSHRSNEKNVINMAQEFVLARTVHREIAKDDGTYNTLSWTGVLQKDDVLRCLSEPQQFLLYQGVAEDWTGFFRAHFLGGS
jgi:hypothetical protein